MGVKALARGVLVWSVGSAGKGCHACRRINVAFRYDDWSECSLMDLDQMILNCFQRHGLCYTVAAIPAVAAGNHHDTSAQTVRPLSEGRARALREGVAAGVVEVAQHGYSHQTTRQADQSKGYSEFFGVEYERQRQRIFDGRLLLERCLGQAPSTFVPPWNSYDHATLRALEDVGFGAISAGVDGCVHATTRLSFVPCTCELFELEQAIAFARRIADPSPTIVALFHPYDFREADSRGRFSLDEFDRLLERISRQEDIKVSTIGVLGSRTNDFSAARYSKHALWLRGHRGRILSKRIEWKRVYWTPRALMRTVLLAWFLHALLYLAVPGILLMCAWSRRNR